MKLLLTSAGLANATITNTLSDLIGKPLSGVKIAFVPTAANFEKGEKDWLVDDYNNCIKAGLKLDIVDVSAIERKLWLPRIEESEVILLGGGNTFHLMHWVEKSGIKDELPRLLEDRVYVGISAGSCIMGPTVFNSVQNLFGEKNELQVERGLGYVPFHFVPHLNSPYFDKIRKENLEEAVKEIDEPVYALDDQSAIVIDGDKMEVVSEGEWLLFE